MVEEDAFSEPNHEGYWIKLDQWNRFRNDTFKDNREAELAFITDADASARAVAGPAAIDEKDAPSKAAIYLYFEHVGQGTHVPMRGRNKGKTMKCELWKCRTCGTNSDDAVHKVFQGSTGGLFKHLKRYHAAEHERASLASTHSRLRVGPDGNLTEVYTFKEALPKHIKFVLFVILDLKHFQLSRSEPFREYSRALDERYVPYSRDTSAKLVFVTKSLMFATLCKALRAAKAQLGEPFAGFQSDIWSPKDNKTSFVCSRLSLIVKYKGKNLDVAPVLGFEEFPENRHTGPAISRYLGTLMGKAEVSMSSSSTLPTLDGAANNKKAFKVMKKRFKVRQVSDPSCSRRH
ncbi:hypothetical protein CYMTET_19899 [Cymbomonas tetramitiformis]|uniref:BED-type domain-containing protein n=1 Tax=Cymbomonas tetramitiformis TaxID=36881 RepID=A0AAE0L4R9_9CHLO|nr:hypothetical protein CYMTET_19899 [Cymbomonas tetramitiformis]